MAQKIIPDSIRDVLHYDPLSGDLIWKVKRKRANPGQPVRSQNGCGYYRVTYNRVTYLAHRVCWFLAHGEQPEMIHHGDNNGLNNRLSNLYASHNSHNQLQREGAKKVYWRYLKSRGKWYATSTYREKRLYMGTNILMAHFRRIIAERNDHPISLPTPQRQKEHDQG